MMNRAGVFLCPHAPKSVLQIMKKQIIETDNFHWTYWPNKEKSSKTMIIALGGASDKGPLFTAAVKTMHEFGCNAATFVPVLGNEKYDGWHDFPLETIQEMARWLQNHGSTHVGIAGASTTSLVSLAAASRIPETHLCSPLPRRTITQKEFMWGK